MSRIHNADCRDTTLIYRDDHLPEYGHFLRPTGMAI
jgi:hypothetical protein